MAERQAEPALIGLLPGALRAVFSSRVRVMNAQRGRTIISVGSRNTDVYFLSEGTVEALLYSANGREVSVRILHPGDIVGELAALDGLPRATSVIAQTDARLVVMSQQDFMACLEASPEAALWLSRRLASEVRRLTERVFELSALNVQARLHCELLRLARAGRRDRMVIDPAPTHAELANRIGTHREAVTRELRELASQGILRAGRRTIEFLDLTGLERAVGRAVGEFAEAPVA